MIEIIILLCLSAFSVFCFIHARKLIKQKKAKQIEVDFKDLIVIDTETTGLTGRDEVLQLSIIDGNGEVLFDEYIKPLKKKTWGSAEKIHGISRDHVANCNHLIDYQKQLEEIFKSHKLVVGYNVGFDFRMLKQSGIDSDSNLFLMYEYDVMMQYKKSRKLGPFPKLKDCAIDLGYTWDDTQAHGSLYDSKATLYCFQQLQSEEQH